jgi:hypothetical protein
MKSIPGEHSPIKQRPYPIPATVNSGKINSIDAKEWYKRRK